MAQDYAPEWLEVEKELGRPVPSHDPNPETKRPPIDARFKRLAAQWQPQIQSVKTRDEKVNDNVTARVYTPEATGSLPVGVFLHGGGFVAGNLDSEDPQCRYIAHHVPCIVVSVAYRLVPAPADIMVDDCVAGYDWAWQHAEQLGGNPQKMFVTGGSAGGHLSFAVTDRLVGNPATRNHIQGCVIYFPLLLHPETVPQAYQHLYKSRAENDPDARFLDTKSNYIIFNQYGFHADNPGHFPLTGNNLDKFPPTWIATGGKDVLRDDGTIAEAMLKDIGVPVARVNYPGLPHFFHIYPPLEKRITFMEDLVKGVGYVLSA
ncbi:alpha/beta-hydrolase [Rhizodiscina lignyota]|uniref:Alpha/beta-hydrolase n=1 Tax=Rhizodiscina lignyota TaxID=1504668 RepID=A0A9P4I9M1_9PEZI|nr:alpha/beta-hydrolase [Rhizodiscina lignyota]